MIKKNNLYEQPKVVNNFHEIEDISERRAYLVMASEKTSTESENELSPSEAVRFLELFNDRYDYKSGRWIDKYMRAFMMLLTLNKASSFGLFNGRRKKEVTRYLTDLGLYGDTSDSCQIAEWTDFAASYITSCTSSKTYGTAFLGIIPMPDKNVALKIASDIDTALCEVPKTYGLYEDTKPMYDIFIDTYKKLLQNGSQLWDEYLASHSN